MLRYWIGNVSSPRIRWEKTAEINYKIIMATLGVWFCICLTIVILSNESKRTVCRHKRRMHSSRMRTAHFGPQWPSRGDRHPPPIPWTEGMTHASENITLPQTSFVGGNETALHSRLTIWLFKKSLLLNFIFFIETVPRIYNTIRS